MPSEEANLNPKNPDHAPDDTTPFGTEAMGDHDPISVAEAEKSIMAATKEAIDAKRKELRQLRSVMAELPQVLTNVKVGSKNGWQENV